MRLTFLSLFLLFSVVSFAQKDFIWGMMVSPVGSTAADTRYFEAGVYGIFNMNDGDRGEGRWLGPSVSLYYTDFSGRPVFGQRLSGEFLAEFPGRGWFGFKSLVFLEHADNTDTRGNQYQLGAMAGISLFRAFHVVGGYGFDLNSNHYVPGFKLQMMAYIRLDWLHR